MFNHYPDVALALQQMGLDAGYEFDEIPGMMIWRTAGPVFLSRYLQGACETDP